MFGAIKKLLGIQTSNHDKHSEILLFSGSAYFSNRVPRAFTKKWVVHGGAISSGTTLDIRARYFFAMDPSEPWVTKLFAKSVMVIHAGWIVHCADQAFRVPITEYILDDRFVPAPPYRLTDNSPTIYVPLSDPMGPAETEYSGSGHMVIQSSDTPSTPTSIPRKRKREQAYFDSPSGSLVFSGFDKDGMPRRPRKQRKLRFDPSFSPGDGGCAREPKKGTRLDPFGDHLDTLGDGAETRGQGGTAGALRDSSDGVGVWSPKTSDKPLTSVEPSVPCRCLSVDEDLSTPTHSSSPAATADMRNRMPSVRAIDFTNLPPRARRGRFSGADGMKSAETRALLSVMRPSEHQARTPKKITFANHARICVYTVSPQRLDTKDGAGAGPARGCSSDGLEDRLEVNDKIGPLVVKIEGTDDSAMEAITSWAPQVDFLKSDDDTFSEVDQSQDTLTLTMDEVQEIRHRLFESPASNGIDDGQLVTLFELGKTFRGTAFRHVW